jgi:hypothetical protein
MNHEENLNKRNLNIWTFMFIKLHTFSVLPAFYVVFLVLLRSAREIRKCGKESCRDITDLKTSSKLEKSLYLSLEFRTWGIKSLLSVPCEPAEAYCPVNAPAGGCSFDGLQSSAILLHHNVPGIFLFLFQTLGDSFHFFTGTPQFVLEVVMMWMQVV